MVAAELAALGFTASANGLEGDRGFFSAAGGGYSADMIDGKLVSVGQTVDGYKLVSVGQGVAVFQMGDNSVTLRSR